MANVSMIAFITKWEEIANGPEPGVQFVATALGLKKLSVQQRASTYRNPPKTKKVKQADGSFLTVDIPESERAKPINLTKMPRGGATRLDSDAGVTLLEKLKADREAAAAAAAAGSETES